MEANSNPLFSVVIPTKNRPNYLEQSIKSALLQDFDDFEVIVSDNFNEQPTQDVIKKYEDHPKFKSFRTDSELNMINHWEFATKKANGKYILLLADRKIITQGGLRKLAKVVQKYPEINAFSYATKVYDDLKNEMGWATDIGNTTVYKTIDLVNRFLNYNYHTIESLDFRYPKTLNGVYKNSFADQVRAKFGRYFNNLGVITPDYSSFFINMALNEEVVYVGETIVFTQGEHTSNGRNFGKGAFESYMNSLGLQNPYKSVPIKAPYIYNLLVIDFLTISALAGGTLSKAEINWNNYLDTCFWAYLAKEKAGLLDEEGLQFFYDAWKTAAETIEGYQVKLQEQRIREFYQNYGNITFKDKILDFPTHLKAFIKNRFGHIQAIHELVSDKYPNALYAAGFKSI